MKKLDKKQKQTFIYICVHAKEIFSKLRWPNGVVCPYCGETHIWHFKTGGYKCSKCGKRFSDTSNTIFHATKIPIAYWLVAYYLITMTKGVSSTELSRLLGCTQKTCWYVLHIIRQSLKQSDTVLTGNIAVDEVYLRGKWSSIIVPKKIQFMKKQGLYYEDDPRRTWNNENVCEAINQYKQPVFGMNDGNKIILRAIPNRFTSTDLLGLIKLYGKDIEHLVSDQSKLYTEIGKKGINVVQMNHSKREYKKDGFSSNRIEGTFSHLKRRYRCQYVRPDKKYMQLYLNEFVFRWNNRDEAPMDRLAVAVQLGTSGGKVTRRTIDSYNWSDEFPKRRLKRKETLEEWFELGWPSLASQIKVQGVWYDKKEFNRLRELYMNRKAGLPFQSKCDFVSYDLDKYNIENKN